MTDTEKVWKEMENLGWSNKPEDFHMEYFEDIIKATKMALMTSQKSDCISDVIEKPLNIHECLNSIMEIIDRRIGRYWVCRGSLRYEFKKAIDKMICSR